MRLKWVVQARLIGRDFWNDEGWSFNPWKSLYYLDEYKKKDYLECRMVLRLVYYTDTTERQH